MKNDFNKFLDEELINLETYGIKSEEDHSFFAKVKLAADLLGVKDREIIKKSCDNSGDRKNYKTIADYYHLIFSQLYIAKASDENADMKKVAYPNISGDKIFEIYQKQYDLVSWSGLVKEIYSNFYEGKYSYPESLDRASLKIKDPEERMKFKRWVKYYNDGNNKKYSNENGIGQMKKQSSLYLPMNGTDAYSGDRDYGTALSSSHTFESSVNEARDKAEMKTSYKTWKKKFNTAWRRMDKILKESEDFVDPDKYEQISEILHKLDVQIGKVRLHSTASDISFGTANQLQKIGFLDGANILKKFAQEVASPTVAAPATQQPTPGSNEVVAAPASEATSEKSPEEIAAEKRSQDRQNETVGEEMIKDVAPIPGPMPNEYDKVISSSVNIDDASKKLEQIAGMLSDRRVIRFLAEFDIMLDKIGIASMFPELSEAQSKLIDSYSYALVRVTKMLGMLSNNRAIMELAAGKQPTEVEPAGAQEGAAEPEPSAAPGATTATATAPNSAQPAVPTGTPAA